MSAITRFPSIALMLSLPISVAPLLTISLEYYLQACYLARQ